MSSPIVLVSGGNRGIGFAIIQSGALRVPNATYILACRDQVAGEKAIQDLNSIGVTATLDVVVLDVTNNVSIMTAMGIVEKKYGRLDVLVNNAGAAIQQTSAKLEDLRDSYNTTFDANVTSVAAVTSTFLPLLRQSLHPRVINISSGRASIQRSVGGKLPPTSVAAYSISKVALNALTIEQQKREDALGSDNDPRRRVSFYAINPGHCKTAFNGYRGAKDPLDGAEAVVRMITAEPGEWKAGSFLEFEEGEMREVPW